MSSPSEQEAEAKILAIINHKTLEEYAATELVMNIFRDYGNSREREGRIDELENRLRIQFLPSQWERMCAEVNSWAKWVDRRIAQLKEGKE